MRKEDPIDRLFRHLKRRRDPLRAKWKRVLLVYNYRYFTHDVILRVGQYMERMRIRTLFVAAHTKNDAFVTKFYDLDKLPPATKRLVTKALRITRTSTQT